MYLSSSDNSNDNVTLTWIYVVFAGASFLVELVFVYFFYTKSKQIVEVFTMDGWWNFKWLLVVVSGDIVLAMVGHKIVSAFLLVDSSFLENQFCEAGQVVADIMHCSHNIKACLISFFALLTIHMILS